MDVVMLISWSHYYNRRGMFMIEKIGGVWPVSVWLGIPGDAERNDNAGIPECKVRESLSYRNRNRTVRG